MDTVFRKKRIAGGESGDRFSIHGGVPKWLKGPDSKSGRSVLPAQEFESLHLRQARSQMSSPHLASWLLLLHFLTNRTVYEYG